MASEVYLEHTHDHGHILDHTHDGMTNHDHEFNHEHVHSHLAGIKKHDHTDHDHSEVGDLFPHRSQHEPLPDEGNPVNPPEDIPPVPRVGPAGLFEE